MKIESPTHCPSCAHELEWSNHLLYCRNPSCNAKAEKRVSHFVQTVKIKGLGPASINKLNLASIADIYDLTEEYIADHLNSDKLAKKLIFEINNSKDAPLNLVLPAFSIPLIGKTAAEKLSTTCNHITDITEATSRQAGLGPKATENLIKWMDTEFPLYKDLPFSFKFEKKKQLESKGIVCISGRLKSYRTKAEANKILEELGYTVKSSLTKDVTILINESGVESAKTTKARDSGVTILTNIQELIGEIE